MDAIRSAGSARGFGGTLLLSGIRFVLLNISNTYAYSHPILGVALCYMYDFRLALLAVPTVRLRGFTHRRQVLLSSRRLVLVSL